MAGIYIHIPFCKKACHYCDFHFSTSAMYKDEMVSALKNELRLQKNYLGEQVVETIYLGGGTPSVLSADELKSILGLVEETFQVSGAAEITIEANPDDLNPQKVRELRSSPINRFSIGIQSFFEEDLRWMNRAHTAAEADSSIKRVQDAGFENITADLIYGYPLLSDEKWLHNIQTLIELAIPHVSSYSMTIEPRTAFASMVKTGKQQSMDDSQSASHFGILIDELTDAGFDHYEISNFSKPGRHSQHNSNYWEGVPYLGIGPSAHSFNGDTRQWNIANNASYISSLARNEIPAEIETLSVQDKINEYIMTSLRTSKGMSLEKISAVYGHDDIHEMNELLQKFEEKGWLNRSGRVISLSKQGKLFADFIAGELFVEEK